MFDHDGDQQISLEEFKQKLGPFCGVKPIETKDLKAEDYTEKDKQELVERFNEHHRKKALWEDYNFDANDLNEVQRREDEQKQLIIKKKMPVEEIKGEIQV